MKIWNLIIIFLFIILGLSIVKKIDVPNIDDPSIDDNKTTNDDVDVEKIILDDVRIIF